MSGVFDSYKQRIPIARAAETIGYVIRADKGRGRSVTMGLRDGHGNWGDQIVIVNHNFPGMDYYFNRNEDSRDKGDLVSFINNHLSDFRAHLGLAGLPASSGNYDIEGIKAVLEALSGIRFEEPVKTGVGASKNETTAQPFRLEDYDIRPLDARCRDFLLTGRKLSPSTVDLFSPFIQSVAYTAKGNSYFNTAFPYRVPGHPEVCNFEVRNYKYKGHCAGGNKVDACWVAAFNKEPWDIEYVYLFESAIDAMSFYELNSVVLVTRLPHVAFVSTGGSLSRAQVLALREYFEVARFVCCFDNDESGLRYDITTACTLSNLTLQRSVREDSVVFNCNGREFAIPKDKLTFTAFSKASGLRQNVLVKKPRFTDKSLLNDGTTEVVWFKDWNDCLKYRKTPKKEYVLYRGNARSFNNV